MSIKHCNGSSTQFLRNRKSIRIVNKISLMRVMDNISINYHNTEVLSDEYFLL